MKERLRKTLRKEHNSIEEIPTTADNKVLLDEMEKLRASIGGEDQEEDNEKISKLVEQYKEFKKKNLANFLFNPQKGTEKYCKWKTVWNHLIKKLFTNQAFNRSTYTRILSTPGSDLL